MQGQIQLASASGRPMRRMLLALTGLGLALAVSASAGVRAPSPTTPAAVTATTFLVSGRGWGHGVGMSQYGALGYAQDGWTYDQILGHFYTGAELGPSPVAGVRVLVAEAKGSVTVRSSVPFRVRDVFGKTYALPAGDVPLGPKLRVAINGTPTELAGPILFLPGTAPLELDRPYRGQIAVSVTGQKLDAVNVLGLEAVPPGRRRAGDAERVAGRGAEGTGRRRALLRARAPAERQGASTSTPTCAARSTAGSRARALVRRRRSRRQRAQVLLWEGKPIDALFHSTSGGTTLDAAEVFGTPVPVPRRGRRPPQRALAGSPLGAGRGGGGGPAQGPQVPGAGDVAPADARAVRTRVDRAGDDAGGDDEDQRRGAPACGRPALDLDHAARDDVADAPGRAGPLRQDGGSDRPGERGEGRAAAAAGRRRLDEGGRACAEGEREAARACQLPDRRRQAGGIGAEGAGRAAADRATVRAVDGGGDGQAAGARRARRAPARNRAARGRRSVRRRPGSRGNTRSWPISPGATAPRIAPVQGFAEGLSGQIELR